MLPARDDQVDVDRLEGGGVVVLLRHQRGDDRELGLDLVMEAGRFALVRVQLDGRDVLRLRAHELTGLTAALGRARRLLALAADRRRGELLQREEGTRC
jgi:hypothetical protein